MSDAAVEFKPNLEKLKKLQASASSVVIGGKVRMISFQNVEKKMAISNIQVIGSSTKGDLGSIFFGYSKLKGNFNRGNFVIITFQ